jgi:hypothetical protein
VTSQKYLFRIYSSVKNGKKYSYYKSKDIKQSAMQAADSTLAALIDEKIKSK